MTGRTLIPSILPSDKHMDQLASQPSNVRTHIHTFHALKQSNTYRTSPCSTNVNIHSFIVVDVCVVFEYVRVCL